MESGVVVGKVGMPLIGHVCLSSGGGGVMLDHILELSQKDKLLLREFLHRPENSSAVKTRYTKAWT